MKCNRKIPGKRTIVDSLWEVRLKKEVWALVLKAAEQYQTTYSWVIRWCVFTAINSSNIADFAPIVTEFHNSREKGSSNTQSHHRAQLCLYGADETMLKSVAHRLGTTVTSLIRAALHSFLLSLVKTKVSKSKVFYHGLKISLRFEQSLRYDFGQVGNLSITIEHLTSVSMRKLLKKYKLLKEDAEVPVEWSY